MVLPLITITESLQKDLVEPTEKLEDRVDETREKAVREVTRTTAKAAQRSWLDFVTGVAQERPEVNRRRLRELLKIKPMVDRERAGATGQVLYEIRQFDQELRQLQRDARQAKTVENVELRAKKAESLLLAQVNRGLERAAREFEAS